MATSAHAPGEMTAAFAAEVRAIVAERQIRKDHLAAQAGMDKSTLSRLLSGVRVPTLEHVDAIAAALDIPPDHLMAAVERRRRRPIYLPDGTIDPAVGSTARTSDGQLEALRTRS